jgi:hypothetical protein
MKFFFTVSVIFVMACLQTGCTSKPDEKNAAKPEPAVIQPNSNAKPAEPANAATTPAEPAGKPDSTEKIYRLEFKELAEKNDIPYCGVYLSVNGKPNLIKSFNSASCNVFEKSEYAEKGIPATAIDAGGGWYAGAGSYFYLIMKNGEPVVYEGWQEEEQTDKGYHWQPVKQK